MQLSQLSLVEIEKFQCPSDSKFLEFFKTPITFIPSIMLKVFIANQNMGAQFCCSPLYRVPQGSLGTFQDRLGSFQDPLGIFQELLGSFHDPCRDF